MCLGIGKISEHTSLSENADLQCTLYVDRTDALDVKPIKRTHKIFQMFHKPNHNSLPNSFIISYLPCSCVNCLRNLIDWNNYEFSDDADDEDEDNDDMRKWTVRELKDACLTYYLPRSRNKPDLIARIISHLESLSCDETNEFQHLDDVILENDI